MSDGYVVVRRKTLAYLVESARVDGTLQDVPEEVARDLGVALERVEAPVDEDRLAAVGPILSAREHESLLLDDRDLELPRDRQSGAFWRQVMNVTLSILRNEAEAVRRVISERTEDDAQR